MRRQAPHQDCIAATEDGGQNGADADHHGQQEHDDGRFAGSLDHARDQQHAQQRRAKAAQPEYLWMRVQTFSISKSRGMCWHADSTCAQPEQHRRISSYCCCIP